MQFFQFLTVGVVAIVGCSGNLIHLNGQKILHSNKLVGLQQIDHGNKLIGLNAFDNANKIIGLSSFDNANKLIDLNSFDTGNKLIGLQTLSQPASLQLATARGFDNSGLSTLSLGGVSPLAIDNSALLLNGNANARSIQLMDVSPALSGISAQRINMAQASSPLLVSGRSADQVITTQAASADFKPVNAAVSTISRTVDYAPMAYSGEPAKTQVVNVPPNEQGLHINFVSKSSPLTVSQQHIPGDAGQVHVSESVDEPQRLVHNVKKSVIQEVNEVVQPFRVLKQEVKPVIEQAHTLVAEGNKIPLSGRSSGVIASESMAPSMAILNRPTQIITAQEPRSLNIATIAQPAAAEIAISQPASAEYAIAVPAKMKIASIAQPRALNFAVTQPRAFGVASFAQQPAMTNFGIQKLAISHPTASTGSLLLANANPSMMVHKGQMMIHQQPSMLIQHKNLALPIGQTAHHTRFFNKPIAFATENMKFQRF